MKKQKQISTLVGLVIIFIAIAVLFGGVFAYQYFETQKVNNGTITSGILVKNCKSTVNSSIKGLAYNIARAKIISEAWSPVQTLSKDNPDVIYAPGADVWNLGYHELVTCSSTGLAPCMFLFRDQCGNYLHVVTRGEFLPGVDASVDNFWINKSSID